MHWWRVFSPLIHKCCTSCDLSIFVSIASDNQILLWGIYNIMLEKWITIISPWCSGHGWLGVKNQLSIYLSITLIFQSVTVFFGKGEVYELLYEDVDVFFPSETLQLVCECTCLRPDWAVKNNIFVLSCVWVQCYFCVQYTYKDWLQFLKKMQ